MSSNRVILSRRRRAASLLGGGGGAGFGSDANWGFVAAQLNIADLPTGNLAGTTVQDETGNWDIAFTSGGTIEVTGGYLVSNGATNGIMMEITPNAGYGGTLEDAGSWNRSDANAEVWGGVILRGRVKTGGGYLARWGYDGAEARGWRIERTGAIVSNTAGTGTNTTFQSNAITALDTDVVIALWFDPDTNSGRYRYYWTDGVTTVQNFTVAAADMLPVQSSQKLALLNDFELKAIRIFRDASAAGGLADADFNGVAYDLEGFPGA